MKKVLVTGATGFLGSHTLKAFKDVPDVEVVVACRSPEKLPNFFTGEVRVGDLTDPDYRRTVLEGIDVVCNAGRWGSLRYERKRPNLLPNSAVFSSPNKRTDTVTAVFP